MSRRSAFTLIEMLIVLVVLAILTMAALSGGQSAAQTEGRRAAEVFEGDVEYARSLTIARPDDPALIKVDVPNNRYWVAQASAVDTPIVHPQTKRPFLRQFGPTAATGSKQVQIAEIDLGGDAVLRFDATGGTDQQTPAVLQFTSGESNYEMSVSPAAANVTSSPKKTLAKAN